MKIVCLAAPLALALSACGETQESESAEDFASRINGGPSESGDDMATPVRETAFPELPKPAADGRSAIQSEVYTNVAADGTRAGLAFNADGTFELSENGNTVKGRYEWLSDGKRLRLLGVEHRPIVLVADGAIYRMTNEDVPYEDVTPDRMFSLGEPPVQ
jgi:hypothetical protein